MKYYQLTDIDLRELGINTELLKGRELIAPIEGTKIDIEAAIGRTLTDEEWEDLQVKYTVADECGDVDEAFNAFIQRTLMNK